MAARNRLKRGLVLGFSTVALSVATIYFLFSGVLLVLVPVIFLSVLVGRLSRQPQAMSSRKCKRMSQFSQSQLTIASIANPRVAKNSVRHDKYGDNQVFHNSCGRDFTIDLGLEADGAQPTRCHNRYAALLLR